MLKKIEKKYLFFRIIKSFLVPITCTGILLFISILYIESEVKNKNREVYANVANEVSLRYQNILSESKAILLSYATDASVVSNLNQIFSDRQLTYERLLSFEAYQNSINISIRTRPYIDSFYYIPIAQGQIQNQILTVAGVKRIFPFLEETLYRSVEREQNENVFFIRPGDGNRKGNESLLLTCFVISRDPAGRANGAFVINLDLHYIEKSLSEIVNKSKGLRYRLFSTNGIVVATNELFLPKKLIPLYQVYRSQDTTYYPVSDLEFFPFTFFLFASREALLLSSKRLISFFIVILTGTFIFGVLSYLYVLRRHREDTLLFSGYLDAIDKNGSLFPLPKPRVSIESVDSEVLKEFMLKDYISLHVSQRELKERKLELENLRKQLSPHFLLNCLQMLNWKVMEKLHGYSDINEIIERLTKVLSYSLYSGDFLVSIEDEINYTKAYVSLMNRNVKQSIGVQWQIDEMLLQRRIPKQIIQPLVENALKYAFDKNSVQPTIIITGSDHLGDMLLCVMDNGKGLTQAKVIELNQSIKQETMTSLGLLNTDRRIKLLFGQRYGLTVMGAQGKGTRIEILLPRIVKR